MLRKRAAETSIWSSSPQPQGIGSNLTARATEAFMAAKPAIIRALEQASRWAAKNKGKTCLVALAAAAFCFNFKQLPFVWHLRVFKSIWFPRKEYFDSRPGSIFRPVVTSSRVSLLETDYNLHKSNSTYYSDLDVARTDLLSALRSQAIRGGLYEDYEDGVQVLLGGTSCLFKKEIRLGAAFDMHSRIFTWDRKWIYVITHFAERRGNSVDGEVQSPNVYATAISKCVVKAGRHTVSPEKFFQAAGVLRLEVPDMSWVNSNKSTDSLTKAKKDKKSKDKDSKSKDSKSKKDKSSKKHADGGYVAPAAVPPPLPPVAGGWTWERVEEERKRALRVAEGFANGLDAAHDEFRILG